MCFEASKSTEDDVTTVLTVKEDKSTRRSPSNLVAQDLPLGTVVEDDVGLRAQVIELENGERRFLRFDTNRVHWSMTWYGAHVVSDDEPEDAWTTGHLSDLPVGTYFQWGGDEDIYLRINTITNDDEDDIVAVSLDGSVFLYAAEESYQVLHTVNVTYGR